MADLRDLANKIRKLDKAASNKAHEVSVAVAEAILTELAFSTPVDTSQAISNWQVGVNQAPTKDLGPYFRGRHGSTFSQSAVETISVGKSALENKKPGETIYITNLMEYIGRLNEGSSMQAPAGFIEKAIFRGELAAKKQMKLTV